MSSTEKAVASAEAAVNDVKILDKPERKMIGRTDEVYNREKRRYEYRKTRSQKPDTFRFTKYVIVVRRKIDKSGFPSGTEVDVRGPRLQKALLELNKDTKGFGFQKDPPTINKRIFFHSLDGLEKLLAEAENNASPDAENIFELKAGIEFVHQEFASTFASLRTLLPNNQINFENLWTLYPPNTIVWSTDPLGHIRAYKVRQSHEATDNNGIPYLYLDTDYIDSDGTKVGWVRGHGLKFPWFLGVKSIWELRHTPLSLGIDPEKIRATLIENGKKAVQRHGRQLVEYQGSALRKVREGWMRFNPHGRVMLDPETWERMEPDNCAVPSVETITSKALMEDEEKLMLVNTMVYGYNLGDKTWGMFAVSQTSDAKWNEEAFKALVLDPDVKEFVHDLVSEHKSSDAKAFDDIVRDKGKGLIGLLAGSPGVGKTLTAEAISEISKRPLYVISSGELGHLPEDVHNNLKNILELAEHWDAVVLLDEADCFLAARDNLDLARNATVSVFLRELEYYQGILILTTNRVTAIDTAFQSRIHFSLQYPDLERDGRRAIWQNFISLAEKREKLKMEISDEDLEVLAGIQLNGRQIKNAMSVSQTVAIKRGKPLTLDTIQTAMRLSQHAWLSEN
ncbi:P-loop containing nucleoside triphosphate hydrolase protein [Periconia macrospinosa]|uniref:P-loop containing nucleoside triphosphate hydrolase protein n=1 Tax=Periconia macrospinosa TaxID=97972 RepID=A0A2V1DFW2_9PLEO|nr:P-loop containing nucleoside triphosphate hydrolase protein [Periconia macrospinosa]